MEVTSVESKTPETPQNAEKQENEINLEKINKESNNSQETEANESEVRNDIVDETDNKVSFKKPALFIGPRRGKVVQLRAVVAPNSNEVTKVSTDEESAKESNVDNPEIEKVKISSIEKQQIPLQYKEPSWSGLPPSEYKIEVLKSGVILETIDINEKNFYVIGRLPSCDISLAHPTISRYHAVLQYKNIEDEKQPKGFYVYDLGSTHGTFWNGCRIRPNSYVRVQGGHIVKFGCSQRKFILQAPVEDVEEESELTVTELKEKRRLDLLERERLEREEKEREEEAERLRQEKEEQDGISWGMGEDADEETDLTENPYALTNNEELFLDDPKKTLRGWFEREGHDLQYETEEKGIGQFLCWVNLPLDTATGRPVRAEALVKGKKKEAVIQCALEACRILDRHGVLRQATHEARKRKTRNWEEEDFYDSDEDNFLDRTGTVEKKREQRMRMAGKLEEKIETYTSLLEKHVAVTKKIVSIEKELRKSQKLKDEKMDDSNEDALDAFMSNLNTKILNKTEISKMKFELQSLRKEEERLLKLVNITKPANLPSLTSQKSSDELPKHEEKSKNSSNVSRKRSSVESRSKIDETLSIDEKAHKMEQIDDLTSTESTTDDSAIDLKKSTEKQSKKSDKLESCGSVEIPQTSVEDSTNDKIEETEKNENEIMKKRKKNMKRMQQRAEKASKETHKNYNAEEFDEDYSMWLPPVNQSGDGKTNLNDKYGY